MIAPVEGSHKIRKVDTAVFTLSYYQDCLGCTFCHDACCDWGADVGVAEKERILARAGEISKIVPHPVEQWFTGQLERDEAMPGGAFTGTRAVDGRCVFRNPSGRGCLLHAQARTEGIDYHDIKPMICSLFPVTIAGDELTFSDDIKEDLICAGRGVSLYRGAREEIRHYFGYDLVAALDELEAEVLAGRGVGTPTGP